MTSVSENSLPASAPSGAASNTEQPQLADAAAMLLPGLQQARTLLDLAIKVLGHYAPAVPAGTIRTAESPERLRRALAEFGHPSTRR